MTTYVWDYLAPGSWDFFGLKFELAALFRSSGQFSRMTSTYRVLVPPGVSQGMEVQFSGRDGVPHKASVPLGASPGDAFVVQPTMQDAPVRLQVVVPMSARSGDSVQFVGPDGRARKAKNGVCASVKCGCQYHQLLRL